MGTRYTVHARDPGGVTRARVFEAESGAAARGMAEALGLEVIAVEAESRAPSAGHDDPVSGGAADPRDRPEMPTWTGSPSQWTNFWWYLSCLLILPIPWAAWKMVSTSMTDYTVTTQRLRHRRGVFHRMTEEVELYRVKDTTLSVTLVQRVLGLGTVVVESSDTSMPRLVIPWVKDASAVRETIRQNVEAVRRARGVRELDVN
jgi:hypothetical protein